MNPFFWAMVRYSWVLLLPGCSYITEKTAERICPPPAPPKVICPPLAPDATADQVKDQYAVCARGQS